MLRSLAIFAFMFCLAVPAMAQVNDENDPAPRNLTSAEQEAIFNQGIAAYDAGDYTRAFELWLPLARRDNMSAQRNVAHLLRRGQGVEQDEARAVYFYRRAAENGLVSAMVNLGAMLRAGQGVDEPQLEEAARWLFLASRAGDPRGQFILGVMAQRGEGMEVNEDLAVALFRMSGEQGLRDAHQRLADMGIQPRSIGDEPERAVPEPPASLGPLPELRQAIPDSAPVAVTQPQDDPPSLRLTSRPESQPNLELNTGRASTPSTQPAATEPAPAQAAVTTPVERPAPQPQPQRRTPEPQPVVADVAEGPPGPGGARPVTPPRNDNPAPVRRTPAPVPDEPEEEELEGDVLRLLGGTQ